MSRIASDKRNIELTKHQIKILISTMNLRIYEYHQTYLELKDGGLDESRLKIFRNVLDDNTLLLQKLEAHK